MRHVFIALLIVFAALLWMNAPASIAEENPENLVKTKCTYCHNADRICKNFGRRGSSEWRATVSRMISKGARVDETEAAAIANYLVTARAENSTLCGN